MRPFECGWAYGKHRTRICRRPRGHAGGHELHAGPIEYLRILWRKHRHFCDLRYCCKVCGRHSNPHRGCILR